MKNILTKRFLLVIFLEKVANKAKSTQQVPFKLMNKPNFEFISSLNMQFKLIFKNYQFKEIVGPGWVGFEEA